jgi:TadE-like protein
MRAVAALRRRLRDQHGNRQRGAAMVEFVLIAPVLVLITAAIFEFGLAFRDSMTLSNALRSGARVGSNAGRERQADYTILKSVEAAMTEFPTAQVERVIVYKAATTNSEPPANCLAITGSGGITGSCNVYQGSDMARPLSDFGGTTSCSGTAPDRYWCPITRQNQQALGADYLGVWMQIRYQYVTKVFPGTGITIRDHAVMRLEPRLT